MTHCHFLHKFAWLHFVKCAPTTPDFLTAKYGKLVVSFRHFLVTGSEKCFILVWKQSFNCHVFVCWNSRRVLNFNCWSCVTLQYLMLKSREDAFLQTFFELLKSNEIILWQTCFYWWSKVRLYCGNHSCYCWSHARWYNGSLFELLK